MARSVWVLISTMMLLGCDPSEGGDGRVACSGASPSFATAVRPLLQGCGSELCHGGTQAGPWPYLTLVDAPVSRAPCDATAVIVKPGHPEQSYLLNKLTGKGMCPGTKRMPSPDHPLPSADIQTIADWICQGAMDN